MVFMRIKGNNNDESILNTVKSLIHVKWKRDVKQDWPWAGAEAGILHVGATSIIGPTYACSKFSIIKG